MKYKSLILSLLVGSSISLMEAQANENVLGAAQSYSVRVKSTIKHAFYEDDAGTHRGAGFLVDREKGWILTNAHVSGRGSGEVEVAFHSSNFIAASIHYVDPELDLAVLKIEPDQIRTSTEIASLDCIKTKLNGLEVAAFGHPHGLTFSASRGIVSRVRTYDGLDWVQTDAAINPGNSGGPLIDLGSGKVVGINAMALKKTEGLNFAVPSLPACKVLALLNEDRDPSPPNLPFVFGTNGDTEEHLIISDLSSAKAELELRFGDRLIKVNGVEVATPTEARTLLRGTIGTSKLSFMRGTETKIFELTHQPVKRVLDREYTLADGALISEDPYQDRRKDGQLFQIHSVREGSYAERSGLRPYTQIVSIEGVQPNSIENIFDLLKGDSPKSLILRKWSSNDNELYEYLEVSYWPYSIYFASEKNKRKWQS